MQRSPEQLSLCGVLIWMTKDQVGSVASLWPVFATVSYAQHVTL